MTDIRIILNGEAKTIAAGTTLASLLLDQPAGTSVVLLKPASVSQEKTSHLRMTTTAGDIVIEVAKGMRFPLELEDTDSLRVHFEDKNAVAFGPFPADFVPAHEEFRYPRGSVSLGCGGYDSQTAYLMFSRKEHRADHGAAAGGAIFGKVIFGLGIMNRWRNSDRITKIERVFSSVDASSAEVVTDMSREAADGMQIFSRIKISAEGYAADHPSIKVHAADSVDHMLFCLREGTYLIDRTASTYIRDQTQGKLYVPMELQKPRREGIVTARTAGKGMGALYVYTSDVPSNPHHTRVGMVVSGIELAKFATEKSLISVEVEPPLLDLRGLLLKEAVAAAKARGLRVMADNRDGESRIVIDQKPASTLEILREGKVSLYTMALEDVIDISLDYVHAPASVDLFRRVTGLKRYPVGTMPFIYNVDDEMYLFKPEFAKGVNIIPENCPTSAPSSDALGLTNDSRPAQGMCGVRLAINTEFGPTGEPFSGTNIIGTIIDIEKLAKLKEGSTVYVREVKQ